MPKSILVLLACWLLVSANRVAAAPGVASAKGAGAAQHQPQVQTLQPGVRLTLVAEQPDLATPTGIDVDQAGRVWLVANHTHMPRPNYRGPKQDEILVFDGQGRRRLFYNATRNTMDLELGPDGWVYLIQRNRLLRVKDTDGDGQGDLEETLIRLDTKAVYPHDGLLSLTWHPDGDLLFTLGENNAIAWTLTGTGTNAAAAALRGTGEGGVFRCRADGSQLRRVARGFWNPFGICVREDHSIFVVDNDPSERPPCRLLYIVEGGDYGYQHAYGEEAQHPFVGWYGQLRGTLPMIHRVGESPAGVSPAGRGLIVPSWSDHRIDFYPLQRSGAGFTAQEMTLVQGGRYFRPTCIAADPSAANDGALTWYLTDWVDGRYQVHGQGRLWKLEIDLDQAKWLGATELQPRTTEAQLAADLRDANRELPQDELLQLAEGEDRYLAHAALTALARRAPQWQPDEVESLPALGRVQAVLALKLAGSEAWIARFLADGNALVQFEALRWIADARLTDYLPAVEKVLQRSDLSFEVFEAAMAAWNTLSGKPEAGVRNVDMLLEKVRDPAAAPNLRAFALRLLPQLPLTHPDTKHSNTNDPNSDAVVEQQLPDQLDLGLLEELLAVGNSALSLESVRTLSSSPTTGQVLLAQVADDETRPAQLRGEAIVGLAAVAQAQLDLLLPLGHSENQGVREEALRSLRGCQLSDEQQQSVRAVAEEFPKSTDLVHAILDPQSLTQGRPELTATAAWQVRLQNVPGAPDVAAGGRVFHHPRLANCSRCHRHHGRGNVVGPDLSAVGEKNDRRWLLESILQPSLQMAPQYRPTLIVLDSGLSYAGIRLQSATFEAIRDNRGQYRRFERNEIETIQELDQSFMPGDLVNSLTDRELRDLIAFLNSPTGQ